MDPLVDDDEVETANAAAEDHQAASDLLSLQTAGGEMRKRIADFDWSSTPLGPITGWPQGLKTAVRIILDSRYPMFIWWGRDLINLYNDGYRPMLGKRHPDALGQSAMAVWAEIWEIVGPQSDAVLQEGRATWNEERLLVLERNGYPEEAYFTFSYSPLVDDDGEIRGVFCALSEDTQKVLGQRRLRVLRDLSARTTAARTVEQACQAATATLSQNLHDLPFTLIYLLDEQAGVARLAGMTGLEEGSAACAPLIDLASPRGESPGWPLSEVAETGRAQVVERLGSRFADLLCGVWPEPPHTALVLPIMHSGQERPAGFLVAGVSPRRALDDDYRGFMELVAGHISTAIANARAYEEERQRAEALAELDRAKTAFFSNISHEFRTPLTLMLGPVAEALADAEAPLPAAQRERLELVRRNGTRLMKLVNTLLDFSRIEAGRMNASYEATELAEFTADLAANFRSACEQAGLELVIDCRPFSEPVFVDRQMWEKVVFNLLSNAFKFTFQGRIRVSLRQVERHAQLSVADTGTGISPEEIPRLFERFHRIENARGRTHEGSGIGLALVQELVKLHGGSISAESTVGSGTTFTVFVPLGAAHLPAEHIKANRACLSAVDEKANPFVEEALRWLPAGDQGPRERMTTGESVLAHALTSDDRPRVLVADDNADMRQYIVRLLSERYLVDAVPDGAAALVAIRTHPPDLVLSDVMMPNVDGFALVRRLRADPMTARVPIILLSARAGEESGVEGIQAGADDYLVKPFSANELLARVSGHLQMARLRAAAEGALRQADRRKDEFLATLAHELRNPLAELFTQVDQHLERAQGGLGIGLSIVKRVVEMHGGTAEVKSEGRFKGSEFLIRLPVSAAPPVGRGRHP
jgi:signal transduction histidine kinase/PAS domain-containing protein